MHIIHTLADRDTQPKTWIALLGRRDMPTDGVEDYCIFLGRGLSTTGVELRRVRVPWLDRGWIAALRELSRESSAWRGEWVLIQYTAFSWSRRGFPFPALIVLALLRRSGARVAVVFHEWCPQGGVRWIDRLRSACQDWVIRRLYQSAAKSIFTVPLETVAWLPKTDKKATFIPIGANLPERLNHRIAPALTSREKNVIVFGVTGAPNAAREIGEIAGVLKEASRALGPMQLVVVGRGSVEAREQLAAALAGCDVKLSVKGILPAEEVAQEFERADALLFVRGAITSQRGSAIAGIACGLPIVGYQNGYIGGPLKEAGVEWSPWGDRECLTRGLIRVLSDAAHWTELHERNLAAQQSHFSWRKIAEGFQAVLTQ
jgi:glycosyltransferase involved in cell wall biosynthesis